MLDGLRSLSQVTFPLSNDDWPLFCCPATRQWLALVHDATGAAVADARLEDDTSCVDAKHTANLVGNACLRQFEACVQSRHTGDVAEGEGDTRAALEWVARYAKDAVLGDSKGFPGPMCSPFRRVHADMLLSDKYTLTEKSDGLRVVLVVLRAPCFPAWLPHNDCNLNVGDVLSVMRLERTMRALADGTNRPTVEVTLHGVIYEATLGQHCSRQDKDGSSGGDENCVDDGISRPLYLCLRKPGTKEGDEGPLCLRRALQPRHLVYALDRAMDAAYLFLDEHTFGPHSCVVLDAELLLVLPSCAKCISGDEDDATPRPASGDACETESNGRAGRLALGLFDLYSYTEADGGVHHQTRQGTLARYKRMQEMVSAACGAPPRLTTGHVEWFVKDVWTIDQLGECLAKLHRDAASQMYWYDSPCGRTRNDGFIFTPDRFDLYSGASRTQVKWKWRALLSVDWRASPIRGKEDLYNVALYFRKINFSYRDDAEGYWQLRRPLRMLNPHRISLPRGNEGAVVECTYDEEHQLWSISRLRRDRQWANSITTVISVFESLAEEVSLATLLRILRVTQPAALACARALEPVAVRVRPDAATSGDAEVTSDGGALVAARLQASSPPRVRLTVRLILRAVRLYDSSHRLYLCWCTNRSNKAYKRVIPCPLCEVKDCNGFGYTRPTPQTVPAEGQGSDLERLLYIRLANAGGSYAWSDFLVEATFDGAAGTWELLRCIEHGRKEEADFDGVLEHLGGLIRLGVPRHTIPAELYERDVVAPQETSTCADTALTSRHYAAKAHELGRVTRDRSALRRFSNWVKSLLLEDAVRVMREAATEETPIRAVDLCCGRGGDLPKWKVLRPAFVYFTDASLVCVAEAAARYCVGEGLSRKIPPQRPYCGFDATFAVHDAFDAASSLAADLHSHIVRHGARFNVVSCQFSMHYGFASEQRVRYFLDTIAAALAPGGVFVGSTVSDDALRDHIATHGADFAGTLYEIHMPSTSVTRLLALTSPHTSTDNDGGAGSVGCRGDRDDSAADAECFGISYRFSVEDTVTDVPEFVVPWKVFVRMSREYGLDLAHDGSFVEYYETHKDTPAGRDLANLLARKRGRSDGAAGHIADECQLAVPSEVLEVARLYRLFVFVKREKSSVSSATS